VREKSSTVFGNQGSKLAREGMRGVFGANDDLGMGNREALTDFQTCFHLLLWTLAAWRFRSQVVVGRENLRTGQSTRLTKPFFSFYVAIAAEIF